MYECKTVSMMSINFNMCEKQIFSPQKVILAKFKSCKYQFSLVSSVSLVSYAVTNAYFWSSLPKKGNLHQEKCHLHPQKKVIFAHL